MRPILEYASIVWESCTMYEQDSLEKLQYEAARVVTGLTRSVSIAKLLREIGWVSLNDRRNIQKLVIVYKEKTGMLPEYLHILFPPLVAANNPYNLRNNDNFVTMVRRTEIYSKSFIPSSVALWNGLSDEIKRSTSLNIFKNNLSVCLPPGSSRIFLHRRTNSIGISCSQLGINAVILMMTYIKITCETHQHANVAIKGKMPNISFLIVNCSLNREIICSRH